MASSEHKALRQTRRYLIVGLLTAAPLWITWLVFDFILTQLSKVGSPWVNALARAVRGHAPALADWLQQPWFQSLLAVVITLAALYGLGWAATRVLGQRIIAAFETWFERVPLVQAIYGGSKRFLAAVKQKPTGVQRVVLIDFPSPPMKAVAFITRVMRDKSTGRELAAVYVPTSPNPTSGYIEIVPLEHVTPTDWTIDEAMSFVITGGTTAPDRIQYELPQKAGVEDEPVSDRAVSGQGS
jgi:uncharacterized membrane protein